VPPAKKPTPDGLFKHYPHTEIDASESHVGLPKGFMGNSEVGHLNIGAGRVVYQDFSLISRAVEDESFFQNPVFLELIQELKRAKAPRTLHLLGLVSDGGVHSHLSHLFALLQLAQRNGLTQVAIHAITDGRDTSPTSGAGFVRTVENYCREIGTGSVASVMGRFFAMDRDSRWERVQKAYEAIVAADTESRFSDPVQYIEKKYDEKITDEFLPLAVSRGYRGVEDGDGIIFFNFRADRARELTRAFTQAEFPPFRRTSFPTLGGFVCMTPYDETLKLPAAFGKPKVPNTLGEVISRLGWKQIRIAETEKYAHVTYFFNGGDERVFDGEKRILVPSPREVMTYDLKPEMSARPITETLLNELGTEDYRFAVINFANCDMVGHTGNLRAAIRAVEAVDQCLGKIVRWVESHAAFAVLTADHGNCEQMEDAMGMPLTSHTLLPVPFVLIDPTRKKQTLRSGGRLCDIAPTLLALWGVSPPAEMTGKNLLLPS
jgi:2,3-bisphosphoglycerate-independent phosphoglycerate mutase